MFAKFWQSHRPLFIVYVEYNGVEINFKLAFLFYGFWGFRKEGNIVFKNLPILFDYVTFKRNAIFFKFLWPSWIL